LTGAIRKAYENEDPSDLFTGLKVYLIRDIRFANIFFPPYEIYHSHEIILPFS
jgi:hypothetical protein